MIEVQINHSETIACVEALIRAGSHAWLSSIFASHRYVHLKRLQNKTYFSNMLEIEVIKCL